MKIAVKIIFFIMAATTLENRQNHFFIPFLLLSHIPFLILY